MKYPNKLREIRKITNVKANDLADLLEVSFQHYYALERGERQLSATQLAKLSVFLNIPIDGIVGDYQINNEIIEQKKSKEQLGFHGQQNIKMASLIARANSLPDQNQEKVIEALEALVKYHEDNKNKK